MKQHTRELLVTTKAAEHWQGDFEQRVDELMLIISKVDNEQQVQQAAEMLDVYHNNRKKTKRKKKLVASHDRPFEFIVFRN